MRFDPRSVSIGTSTACRAFSSSLLPERKPTRRIRWSIGFLTSAVFPGVATVRTGNFDGLWPEMSGTAGEIRADGESGGNSEMLWLPER
jgi:hypothetical protein